MHRKTRFLKGAKMALGLVLCTPLMGCLVAGYSSGQGFWVWPGSLVLTLLAVLWVILRNRH